MFTTESSSDKNYAIPVSLLVFTIPAIFYVIFYIFMPCENVMRNEEKLVEILLEKRKFLKRTSHRISVTIIKTTKNYQRKHKIFQVQSLVLQIRHKPMKISFYNGILFNKPAISFLVAEIFSWFFILLQFELSSLQEN